MRSHSVAASEFIEDRERTDWHNETLWWVRAKRDKASKAIPEWEDLREQASQIKNYTLDHLGELLLQFEQNAIQNGIKVIENYTNDELKQISDKLNQNDNTPGKNSMDLSAVLKTMDLSAIIKRLFGPKCLPGCMSPDGTNRKDSMCKKNVTKNGAFLECPWRCNLKEYDKQLNTDLIFKQDMLSKNLKKCSVDNEDIDCGGCVPLRIFN